MRIFQKKIKLMGNQYRKANPIKETDDYQKGKQND